MDSHRDIIARWPSIAEFARDIGTKYVTAQSMHTRCNIGADYWLAVVSAARRRGLHDVTLEALARLYRGHRHAKPPERSESACF